MKSQDIRHLPIISELEVLLELHSTADLDRFVLEADMVGVNNRDLTTFRTDTNTSLSIVASLPADIVKIAESGISSPDEIHRLRDAGYDGFLIGEHFMIQPSPGKALKQFINEL